MWSRMSYLPCRLERLNCPLEVCQSLLRCCNRLRYISCNFQSRLMTYDIPWYASSSVEMQSCQSSGDCHLAGYREDHALPKKCCLSRWNLRHYSNDISDILQALARLTACCNPNCLTDDSLLMIVGAKALTDIGLGPSQRRNVASLCIVGCCLVLRCSCAACMPA